jgi:hypothetical protein
MKGFKQGAQCGTGVASHGEAMGFKKGGRVKVKDTGNMPAKPDGDSQQEKEAGGRPKVRPGYKKGGKAMKKGGKRAGKAVKRGKK